MGSIAGRGSDNSAGGTSGDGDTGGTSGDGDGDTGGTSGEGTGGSTPCEGLEVDGACVLPCETEGEVRCGESCIDPATSADFCGATEACQDMGNVCGIDESCVLGSCRSWGNSESVGPFLEASGFGSFALVMDDDGNATLSHDASGGTLLARRRAAGGSWSSAHTLDDDAGSNSKPKLAVDGDGNVLAMWASNGSGHGWARYRTQVASWGSSAALDLGTPESGPSFATPTAMAAAPSGDVFIGFDNQSFSAGTEAWTRRFGFEADGWFTADRQDENGTEEASFGTLVVDANANVTATWSEKISDTEVVARASHWSAASNDWSAPADLGNSPYANQAGAADVDGNVALVFCYRITGGQILPHTYDRSTGSWSTNPALVDDPDAFNDNCMIASNSAGDVMLSWEQDLPDRRQILVSRLNPVTRAWQGVTDVMDVLDGSAFPTIGMDAAGNAWVVANRFDANGSEIVARRWNVELQAWENEITIDSVSAPEVLSQPKVAVSQSGSAVVVWSYGADASSSSSLRARAYE